MSKTKLQEVHDSQEEKQDKNVKTALRCQCQTLPGCESTLDEFDWQPALAKASSLMLDETSVKWFPAYGAALLAIGRSSVQGGPIVRRHLHIVGLDKGALKPYWVRPSM